MGAVLRQANIPKNVRRWQIAACVLLLALGSPAGRAWLEADMTRHMLVQLPMLAGAGAILRSALPHTCKSEVVDAHGLTGMTGASLVGVYWMVPRALEASLASDGVEAAKFISLILAGMIVPGSLSRAAAVIQLFFVANLCAMLAIAGMLYQAAPQRLCNAYLLDDQETAGTGLVALAIGLALLWCMAQGRALLGTQDE